MAYAASTRLQKLIEARPIANLERYHCAMIVKSTPDRIKNVDTFAKVYAEKLALAVVANPKNYIYQVDEVPTVASKMRAAFIEGTYSHKGRAVEATCKHFGIAHKRTSIEMFFNGQTQPKV